MIDCPLCKASHVELSTGAEFIRKNAGRLDQCKEKCSLLAANEKLHAQVAEMTEKYNAQFTGNADQVRVRVQAEAKLAEARAILEKVLAVVSGEDQVADDDTEGMTWVYNFIKQKLGG